MEYRIRMAGDFKFDVMVKKRVLFIPYWKTINRFNLFEEAVSYLNKINVSKWKGK